MHTPTESGGPGGRAALQSTLLLQTWLSASFPTGAFSYSHGLESAIAEDAVMDSESLAGWLDDLLMVGSLHNEAVLFAMAWHAAGDSNPQRLHAVNSLAVALAGSAERHRETTDQARAFLKAVQCGSPLIDSHLAADDGESALPVVVADAAARAGIELPAALASWLQSFLGNLVWIAVRLVPLGQAAGLSVIAALQSRVIEKTGVLCALPVDTLELELGSCSPVSDIAAMRHESLPTRICLT